MSENKIKLLLVDDHPILREGLKTVLELNGDFEIVGEADSGFSACELVPSTNPDVVLMDIRMEKMDGIKASRNIKRLYPQTRILLLTMHDDENYILEALEIGVEGYILKMSEMEKVIQAIKIIYDNETYFDPKITKSIAERTKDLGKNNPSENILEKYDLTSREIEVIQGILDGLSSKEIAEKLFISPNTVYNHRRSIFHKLKIRKASELISFAINNNLFLFKEN
ncbi:MAG: response regulator transcription factor [Ignavibacteriaceae bacterium]